jgi:uncharacterized membrane protein YqjE
MPNADEKRTVFNLVASVIDESVHLLQTELRLVRVEINDKISKLAGAGTVLAAGGVAALAALFLLLQALVRWLSVAGLPDQWGYLIVGVVVAIIAGGLLASGLKRLNSTTLVPEKTFEQIRADVAAVKEHVT